MKLGDHRLVVPLSLALFLGCLCSCTTGAGVGPASQEAILIPFLAEDSDPGWEIGYTAENEVQRIAEFVRPGQTVVEWSEMVTVQTFNKAVGLGSVENQFSMFRKDLLGRCPDSKVDVIQQGPKGILYEARVRGCEQGSEEHVFGRLVEGSHSRFMVQYSVREAATMLPERREEWLERLTSVEIVNSRKVLE